MLHASVFNTSAICHAYGVRHAVLSPGSRNAPLIVSFARNDAVKKWIIPDERSAGFIALGIAQQLKQPVVLCCTSGTAVLNYAPAIAEAFYRQIPLIVLSADRPPELIDQRDGQTIRQFEVLKNHVIDSVQLPVIQSDEDAKQYETLLQNVFHKLTTKPGPVHINIPFKEPFYPTDNQPLLHHTFVTKEPVTEELASLPKVNFEGKKVLLVIGQMDYDKLLNQQLFKLGDQIAIYRSPLNNLECGIQHIDFFLSDQSVLRPDILITSGLSVLSKPLKTFLRKHTPAVHYHFDPTGIFVDTYQSNPQLIKASLTHFLASMTDIHSDRDYILEWKNLAKLTSAGLESFESGTFSECTAFSTILSKLPSNIQLHLSNSMPVRFAELFGVKNGIQTRSNRGTSGIDGCTSTALGASLVNDQIHLLITGDLSFLYDRNAFFNKYNARNLRIIVSNNQGGGIFRLINGPSNLPELEDYFETRHQITAEYICKEADIAYEPVKNESELNEALNGFFESSDRPKLIEIFTDPKTNETVFKNLKKHIHEQLNN